MLYKTMLIVYFILCRINDIHIAIEMQTLLLHNLNTITLWAYMYLFLKTCNA